MKTIIALLCAATISACFAVEGIAVSMRTAGKGNFSYTTGTWGDTIWRYDIKNNDVASKKPIFAGKGWQATINVNGTHVAFFKTTSDGKHYVSAVPIDGGKEIDLCEVEDEKGLMTWGVGDWIYFKVGYKGGPAALYRTNFTQPGKKEKYADISRAVFQGNLSADAKRGHFTYDGTGRGTLDNLPGSKAFTDVGGGCGAALSPSGEYKCWWTDANHSVINVGEFAGGSIAGIKWTEWNTWATNAGDIAVTCGGVRVTTGAGGFRSRWSCNSDKWISLELGWPDKARFFNCGSNQCLINWQDKIAINVSQIPRKGCPEKYKASCSKEWPGSPEYAESGDFWVSGPAEDITVKPNGAVAAIIEPAPGYRTGAEMRVSCSTAPTGGLMLRWHSSASRIVEVYSPDGKKIFTGSTSGNTLTLPVRAFAAGVGIVQVKSSESRYSFPFKAF